MKDIVKRIDNRRSWLGRQEWIIPVCFAFSCVLVVTSIVLFVIRGAGDMKPEWMFSIGADVLCMAVCAMLCFSCSLNYKEQNEDTHVFVTLLTTNAFALFLDESSWLVQGIKSLRTLNLFVNVLFFMMGSVLIYLFWEYIRRALKLTNRAMKVADLFVTAMLYPSLLLCLINFFYPLFFSIDENGVYSRAAQWDVSQIYLGITLTVVIIAISFAKASNKDRFVAISFIAIPLINQVLTFQYFGISTQYASMTVSIVLIYGVLFAEREKMLASTEMELDVATRIQANMLPNKFPFMPERTEFDLYASMDPAKEVGGDFYDCFMVDDDRLALVIADVSGKGIPAALFMMASKILIKNCIMTGESPGEVLRTVNNQICENNQEEMFVTVWLGILDLCDGTLVSANAGHEYPVYKTSGGDFSLCKTKHSFVVGGMKGIKYKESQMQMEPDSKLFVYTDGVPEAEDATEEQYGYDRFLAVLNKNKDADPKQLLTAVDEDVQKFVQNQPQFDDLTMLCIHYKGKEK
ncbi:MAG: PP2C family protein-serine/threonine phosphatase [Ruminococcus sp.]|nr:PP2C family protein-serine/threonine phosphatase [Ruminococcus sp.]